MANLLAEYEARPGLAMNLITTWVSSLDEAFLVLSNGRPRDAGPNGETYPAPLLMRTILPEPLARMLGRRARTLRRGP